jgi:2-octaprenyl-6-methoxyphenol hydroxylase
MHSNDIVIAGCSYTGMLMALSMAAYGMPTTIIDKQIAPDGFFDPRTTSITSASKRFFMQIGVWQSLEILVSPIKTIYVIDNKKSIILDFEAKDEPLGHMIQNTDFKKALFALVEKNQLITLKNDSAYTSVNLTEEGCCITLQNQEELETPLLVACDGKNSQLRAQYFPYIINKDYGQVALVFNTKHEKDHEQGAVEHFLPHGVFAILPLQQPTHSAIVWSMQTEHAIAFLALNPQQQQLKVQELFGPFLGEVAIITPISSFNLSAQMVKNYFHKQLVLVGDSAHSIHPLAGQGLNQGIKDISKLTSIIRKCYNLGLTPDGAALADYQRARGFDNIKMFMATDFLNRIFCNNSKLMSAMRTAAFNGLDSCQVLKQTILNYGTN